MDISKEILDMKRKDLRKEFNPSLSPTFISYDLVALGEYIRFLENKVINKFNNFELIELAKALTGFIFPKATGLMESRLQYIDEEDLCRQSIQIIQKAEESK